MLGNMSEWHGNNAADAAADAANGVLSGIVSGTAADGTAADGIMNGSIANGIAADGIVNENNTNGSIANGSIANTNITNGGITNDSARQRMPRTVAESGQVLLLDSVGSTNTALRELIAGDAPQGRSHWPFAEATVAVVAADRQTAGRGRLDHVWSSAIDDASAAAVRSFTVSFAMRVPAGIIHDVRVGGWVQMIAGLAARDAVVAAVSQELGVAGDSGAAKCAGAHDTVIPDVSATRLVKHDSSCDVADRGVERQAGGVMPSDAVRLKWPNDLFCCGRKLGGILAEMVVLDDDPDAVAVIVGIGINLDVPADRLPTAQSTSLSLMWSGLTGRGAVLRDAIAAGMVRGMRSRLGSFVVDPDSATPALADEMRSVCWTLGRPVEVHYTDGETLRGTAVGLNDDASLSVRDADGTLHVVTTGDVGVL